MNRLSGQIFWVLLISTSLLPLSLPLAVAAEQFRSIAVGLEIGTFHVAVDTTRDDSTTVIVRVNPVHWELKLLSRDSLKEPAGLTAKQWCQKYGLAGAINAGMFLGDMKTHVGYMKSGSYVNQRKVNGYRSVAAFNATRKGLPPFRIFDLDADSIAAIIRDYSCVVQNLRLIKHPGSNCWSQQDRRWSEAALGEDSLGRILMIFCRTAFSMHDLDSILLSLPIGLVAAQHLEGGPEAQLFLASGSTRLGLVGSFETGFNTNYGNTSAWPIPNVIGIVPKGK
jgi:hypothetical protein